MNQSLLAGLLLCLTCSPALAIASRDGAQSASASDYAVVGVISGGQFHGRSTSIAVIKHLSSGKNFTLSVGDLVPGASGLRLVGVEGRKVTVDDGSNEAVQLSYVQTRTDERQELSSLENFMEIYYENLRGQDDPGRSDSSYGRSGRSDSAKDLPDSVVLDGSRAPRGETRVLYVPQGGIDRPQGLVGQDQPYGADHYDTDSFEVSYDNFEDGQDFKPARRRDRSIPAVEVSEGDSRRWNQTWENHQTGFTDRLLGESDYGGGDYRVLHRDEAPDGDDGDW